MKHFVRLLKLQVLNYFHISVMQETYIEKRERLWEPWLFGITMLIAAGSLGRLVFMAARSLLGGLPAPFAEMVLTIAILATQMMALGFGLASLISLFYFSADLAVLVPLPLREWTILATKFVVATITEYVPPLILLTPVLIAYHQRLPLGLSGILSAAAVFLLLPLIPLALAGIMTITLMRSIGRRHRDVLIVVASVLSIAGILAVQYFMQSLTMGEFDAGALLQGRLDLVTQFGSVFPPSIWATRAISRAGELGGLANLLYLALASAGAVGIFLVVGQKVFYSGLIGGEERLRQRSKLDAKSLARVSSSSALTALTLREIRLFMRMPIWVLNGFAGLVILPLMIFFPAFAGNAGLAQFTALLAASPAGLTAMSLIFATLLAVLASTNTVACTALSREGKHLWISQSIPVAAVEQVKAKLIFSLICTLVTGVPVIVIFASLFSPDLPYLLLAYVLGVVGSIAPQALGLAFDIWRPFLKWTTPQHAVKNNLNAVISLVGVVPLGVVSFYVYVWLRDPLGVFIIPMLIVLHLMAAIASVHFTLRKAAEFYRRLEVTS